MTTPDTIAPTGQYTTGSGSDVLRVAQNQMH